MPEKHTQSYRLPSWSFPLSELVMQVFSTEFIVLRSRVQMLMQD